MMLVNEPRDHVEDLAGGGVSGDSRHAGVIGRARRRLRGVPAVLKNGKTSLVNRVEFLARPC
jgi:hypothetical protein